MFLSSVCYFKDIEQSYDSLNQAVNTLLFVRQHYLAESSPDEMHEIDVNLSTMRSRWNQLEKKFRMVSDNTEQNASIWTQMYDDMDSFSMFVTKVEKMLDENKSDDLEKVRDVWKSDILAFVEESYMKEIHNNSKG